jgi:SAM-dependent methyltransferase
MDAEAAEEHRRASRERWDRTSAGWRRRAELLSRVTAPVSQWLVEAIQPQPGHRVLELAAGMAETGMLAAELVRPGGTVIISDHSEGMLAGARDRAKELGLENVEFKQLDAEWIDLPLAHVDGVLCRWGYMLLADPAAALRETRRVLRPGGRVALAVWDTPDRNPWISAPGRLLVQRGLAERPPPDEPGPFALADEARLHELIEEAGFSEIEVDGLEFAMSAPDFEELWDTQMDMSMMFREVVGRLEPDTREQVRVALAEALAPFTGEDGAIEMPARTLVATAAA